MKVKNLLLGLFASCAITSCIQDEAPNVEAAIDGCEGENILLTNISHNTKEIEVYMADMDMSKQTLVFTLADKATIQLDDPETNDTQPALQKDTTWTCQCDFSQNKQRHFTVKSESGSNQATYTLSINTIELSDYTKYSFEELKETTPYHVLYLTTESGIMQWASGNPGFEISGMAQDAEDYPTAQSSDGYSGKCVKLTTRDTGNFGKPIGMPIAAGNLFIGSFDVQNAIQHPLQATLFGFPFTKKPVRMTGYYKYKAGETFTDENKKEEVSKSDMGDIYAALYESFTGDYSLNGDLFPQDKPIDKHIVSLARIGQDGNPTMAETDQWTRFELSFEPQNGKTIDEERLRNGEYKLAIVFTSSIEGAYFRGAVGSELYVDEVEIVCE